MATLRIGIYGGTFNPIHNAHLLVAQTAYESLHLDKVVFIPAGIPPLKGVHQLVSGEQRLAMVQLAIADNPNFELNDFEVRRGNQKSFTIDTVRFLVAQYPANTEFFLILGDDCVDKLHHWKGIDELRQLVQFVCVNRNKIPATKDELQTSTVLNSSQTPPLTAVAMPTLAISSTYVRERLNAGKTVHYLVPTPVAQYLDQHALYRMDAHALAEIAGHE